MKFKTFATFVGPSLFLMFLFIAAPLISVFMQSFYLDQPVMETVEIENCTPGFPDPICTTETRTRPALDENGQVQTITRFVGLESYRNVIQPDAGLGGTQRVRLQFAAHHRFLASTSLHAHLHPRSRCRWWSASAF